MPGRKLLVYSDGGAPRRRPYASFAAYDVDFETDWSTDFGAHERLACRTMNSPLVHVSREQLFPKVMSNTAAEARALRMAVCWAGHYCADAGDVSEVEFCSDDRTLVDMMNSKVPPPRSGKAKNDLDLIAANMKRNFRNVGTRFTWIPGDWMKASVINH